MKNERINGWIDENESVSPIDDLFSMLVPMLMMEGMFTNSGHNKYAFKLMVSYCSRKHESSPRNLAQAPSSESYGSSLP